MELDTVDQWQALIEHSSDLITVLDENGVIQFQSPSTEHILGYHPTERVGERAFEQFHPDDRERVVTTFTDVIESPGETTERVEYRYRHADGSWVWLESIGSNRMDTVLGGFVINSRDITDRKQYEKQLEALTTELETLNQVLRHDIRNDMAVILAWASLLEDHVDEDGQDHLNRILKSGEHVVELTDIAREYVEALRTDEVELKPVPLRPLLESELALRQESFPRATFLARTEIPDVEVRANEMLVSVFRNLLTNAVQHNDSDEPAVELSFELRDREILVSVEDNGPGVPDDHKESIFGKGEKGLDSPGTGFGLYLVRTLVVQYGGDVWVEDNDPEGAKFVVELSLVE